MSESRTIDAHDGAKLELTVWEPEGEVRFVVMITHGLAEHAMRYDEVAEELGKVGGLCFGIDLRGQGHSGGPPGHVERFEDYASDLLLAAREMVESLPASQAPENMKWFVFGHSMGALVTLIYLLDHEKALPLAGAVLSAPFLEVGMHVPWVKRAAARVANRLAPRLQFPTGIDADKTSRDPERIRMYADDPRRIDVVTPRWADALERAQARVKNEVGELELPMLWYAGTADGLVNTETTREVFEKSVANNGSDRTLELLEGFFHEGHNEPLEDRQRVFALVRDWVVARLEAAS